LLVNDLYNDFLKEFGSTECKTLNEGTDFSNPNVMADWAINKKYKQTCDVFLKFVFEKCLEMVEDGKI